MTRPAPRLTILLECYLYIVILLVCKAVRRRYNKRVIHRQKLRRLHRSLSAIKTSDHYCCLVATTLSKRRSVDNIFRAILFMLLERTNWGYSSTWEGFREQAVSLEFSLAKKAKNHSRIQSSLSYNLCLLLSFLCVDDHCFFVCSDGVVRLRQFECNRWLK